MLNDSEHKARGGGGVGEGEDHRKLKQYIANNPMAIGLSGFGKGVRSIVSRLRTELTLCFENTTGGLVSK